MFFKKKKRIFVISKDSGMKLEDVKKLYDILPEDEFFFILVEGDLNRVIQEI